MEEKSIIIAGYKVDIVRYSKDRAYMYPSFNGNFEVECNAKGYKRLSSYLRGISWINKTMTNFNDLIFNQ